MKMATRLIGGVGAAAVLMAAGAVALTLGGAGTPAPAAAPAPAEAKTYTVDPVHSSVVYRVTHLQASHFYGQFEKVSGQFTAGDTLSIDVTVDAASVNTRNPKRDDHVRSPDFLSAKEFGQITFSAKGLKKSGEGWKGTGELTFRGQKKPLEVEIKQVGTGKGMDGKTELMGLESTFTIKRSDFGSKGLIPAVSDDVMIIVALEAGAK